MEFNWYLYKISRKWQKYKIGTQVLTQGVNYFFERIAGFGIWDFKGFFLDLEGFLIIFLGIYGIFCDFFLTKSVKVYGIFSELFTPRTHPWQVKVYERLLPYHNTSSTFEIFPYNRHRCWICESQYRRRLFGSNTKSSCIGISTIPTLLRTASCRWKIERIMIFSMLLFIFH